jgi:hypothetical protein
MKKMLALGCLVAGALVISGCGSKSCKDLCASPCNGASTANCNAGCDQADKLNSASSCTSQYDSMLSCVSKLSDTERCSDTSGDTCKTEGVAYASCIVTFCASHTSDANCSFE